MKKIMHKSILNWCIVATGFISFLLTACTREDLTKITPTPLDLVATQSDLTMFAKAVERTGVKINIAFPLITVFAPTDEAFRVAGISDVNAIDLTTLRNIVNYHVINTRLDSSRLDLDYFGANALNHQPFQTLNFVGVNTFLYLNHISPNVPRFNYTTSPVPAGMLAINGVNIIRDGFIRGANGTLFKIERVLMPPPGLLSVVIAANPDLSLFNRAIRRAIQTGQVLNFATNTLHLGSLPSPAQAGSGAAANRVISRTVFAPNNAAMIAAGFNEAAIDAATPAALFNIVAAHVLAERCFSSFYLPVPATNANQPTLATSPAQSLNVVVNASGVNVGLVGSISPRANVVSANTTAFNGILHIIDRVMQ